MKPLARPNEPHLSKALLDESGTDFLLKIYKLGYNPPQKTKQGEGE